MRRLAIALFFACLGPCAGAQASFGYCGVSLGPGFFALDLPLAWQDDCKAGLVLRERKGETLLCPRLELYAESPALAPRLLGPAPQKSHLLFGSASLSGLPAFLSEPAAFAKRLIRPPAEARPLELDRKAESPGLGLSCGTGPLSFFALKRGRPGLVLGEYRDWPWPAGLSQASAKPLPAEAVALSFFGTAGFMAALRLDAWALSYCVEAVWAEEKKSGSGWKLDRPPEPGGLSFCGALSCSYTTKRTISAAGIAASLDMIEGPDYAARAEFEAKLKPVSLLAVLAASGRRFRGSDGSHPDRELGAALDLGFSLPRRVTMEARLRYEKSNPLFESSLGPSSWSMELGLEAPFGKAKDRLTLSASAGLRGAGSAPGARDLSGQLAFGLRYAGPDLASELDLDCLVDSKGLARARCSLSASLKAPAGSDAPALDCALSLGLVERGSRYEGLIPARAELRAALKLPAGFDNWFKLSLKLDSEGKAEFALFLAFRMRAKRL